MAEKTATCAVCNQEKPIRLLRFNKNEVGEYEYQCDECRKRARKAATT